MNQPYIFLKTIKERADGAVRLVRCRETGKRMILRQYRGDCSVYRRLMEVDCPHLPRIYRVDEQDGMVTVLEEYIWGDSLEDLLQGCPMTPEEAAKIAAQLCAALEVLHGFGAVHRDIKPTNIILREDHAVLIDFDAARIHKEEQSTDTRVMGTTGYAAPEQYGFAQTDARTDIYAMGVLLNVMVTGQHPSKVLVEGRLRKIVETCIQVHADRRYPSAKALAEALTKKHKRVWPWVAVFAAVLLVSGLLMGQKAPAEPPVIVEEVPVEQAVIPEETPEPPPEVPPAPSLQINSGPVQPSYGVRQFDFLLDGEILTAAQVESVFLSDPKLGEILSAEAENESGRRHLDLNDGHWLWNSQTAYPNIEGQMRVTVGGEEYTIDVSTGDPEYRFYTDTLAYIPANVDQVILYEPGSPATVDFEVLNLYIGPITAVRCDNNVNVTWELDEAAQRVRFTLNTQTSATQAADLIVEINGGAVWCTARVRFVPNTLSANVSMKNCRIPGTMQFDLLLGGEPVASERVSSIELSDPALGEILSVPALMAEGNWAHGTQWGQWLWVVESAIPHTAGILTAVIDGVPFYTEVSTGAPDCGYYTDPGFSDEDYLPFNVTKVFEYEPGQDLTVWFTTFNGETILRAYTDHEEFFADLPEEPTDTVAFTLNPDLTGDHSFRFTVVTNNGIYRILRASLLEKQ